MAENDFLSRTTQAKELSFSVPRCEWQIIERFQITSFTSLKNSSVLKMFQSRWKLREQVYLTVQFKTECSPRKFCIF